MKPDCGFTKENHWFRYRTGGIIIHNGKMLFVKSKIGGYYYMNITDEQRKLCKEQTDIGEQLVWVDIGEVESSFIKPAFIGERITEILNSKNPIHIIEECDR